MPTRTALLRLLCDGRFHSGAELGAALGIGRSAVWKHVRALAGRGIEIHAVRGRGYRLAVPLELLDGPRILAALPPVWRGRLAGLEILQETDSTNRVLLARGEAVPAPCACLAEYQSAGRGRRGRTWVSPYGRNIYLSLLWRFAEAPAALSALGLVAGVAVLRAVTALGLGDAGLKWPNDVLWGGAKLAGVLVELSGEMNGACRAVIGVGLNLAMPRAAAQGIDQPWVDLASAMGRPVSRNACSALLLARLLECLELFQDRGFAPFAGEWHRHDVLRDRPVALFQGGRCLHGTARGVDEQGALIVERDGKRCRYFSGDVSLRLKEGGAVGAAAGSG